MTLTNDLSIHNSIYNFIKLYQTSDFINKLMKPQKFCKQTPIHFYGVLR